MDMYRIYQLKNTEENKKFLFQSFEYVISHGGTVHVSRYNMVYEGALLTAASATDVRDAIKRKPGKAFSDRPPGTGDVITISHPGTTECYYLDTYGMVSISGFLGEVPSDNKPLTPSTSNYVLAGKAGTWQVVDTVTVEDHVFFQLESMEFGRRSACIITDATGHIITDNNRNDFDDETIALIKRTLHPEQTTIIVSKQPHGKPPMEQHQKYFENGTYERSGSSEVTGEQNYNMIDGNNNNAKKPEERESVRERLKKKLELVHGGPSQAQEIMRRQ